MIVWTGSVTQKEEPASVAQLDAPSDWRPGSKTSTQTTQKEEQSASVSRENKTLGNNLGKSHASLDWVCNTERVQ